MKSVHWCITLAGLAAMALGTANVGRTAEPSSAAGAPPLLINLDRYDAAKRFVA